MTPYVLVTRGTLEALLADATEALDAIPNTGRDYVRDRVQNIADNVRALLGETR